MILTNPNPDINRSSLSEPPHGTEDLQSVRELTGFLDFAMTSNMQVSTNTPVFDQRCSLRDLCVSRCELSSW